MILCNMEKVLLASKQSTFSQWHAIFRTMCTIEGKVCELIAGNGCIENVIAKSVVKALQVSTTKHPNSYTNSWIKKVIDVVVSELCKVNFSIRKNFNCEVLCYLVEIDVCRIRENGETRKFDYYRLIFQS